ncbi:formylglycine-generating enzyme family protein [Sinimarinibacterium thermocellulolyticum]|uniref:SUMF1/EgtB/PvdO family nonheme iron enzyme n=1 Tax=Sinimarinibacterium thermocellulolyticum TaxID=3170016 RepID=A0ABV2A645_9GAMM
MRRIALALLALPLVAGADMIRVPGGQTRIGDDAGRADEKPSFLATVAAFELDRAPVTVSAFARYVAAHGIVTEAERVGSAAVMSFGSGHWRLVDGAYWLRPLGPDGPKAVADHPVTQVSWNDAQAYCAAHGKRLPTEIEFEHAARLAGHGGRHAFGAQLVAARRYRANVWTGAFPAINTAADGYRTTSPVGAFGRDGLGFEDLAGNVWEWSADWYAPYGTGTTATGSEKAMRGGSFLCDPNVCYGFRVSARAHATPDSALMHVGFRCARDLTD